MGYVSPKRHTRQELLLAAIADLETEIRCAQQCVNDPENAPAGDWHEYISDCRAQLARKRAALDAA